MCETTQTPKVVPATAETMPKYKCHKVVAALKIKQVTRHAHEDPAYNDRTFEASAKFKGGFLHFEDERFIPLAVDADWYRKHAPMPGNYFVVYDDGYTSCSPANAFESGYTKI
jgi:hypothetical protein